jgi:protein gp37
MATTSSIEWTDTTWNPVVGCSIVSPGCHNCYAAVMAKRLRAMADADLSSGREPGRKAHYLDAIDPAGRWTGKLIQVPESLADPLGWKKPRKVFVNSMSDLFHEELPFDFIAAVFGTMAMTNRHTYQVLTKRPDRALAFFREARSFSHPAAWCVGRTFDLGGWTSPIKGNQPADFNAWPLPNVWLGTSVEDQNRADERIPELMKCPAAVRFLSIEPLLGPVDLGDWIGDPMLADSPDQRIGELRPDLDWLIVGGESGHKSRPCNIEWIRRIIQQGKAAAVPVFVKQLGERFAVPNDSSDEWPKDGDEWIYDADRLPRIQGEDVVLHMPHKGGEIDTWPTDLRVRQFPAEKVLA